MTFEELFNSVRFPKRTQTHVTKPIYQISAEEYNALAEMVRVIVESGGGDEFKHRILSESEYQKLVAEGRVQDDVMYFTYEEKSDQTAALSPDKETLILKGVTLSEDKETITLKGQLTDNNQTLVL